MPEDTDRTAPLERVADPAAMNLEVIWDEEWEKNLVDAAIEKVKARLHPKQYQMFDLYVLKKWPAGEVARSLHVNMGQVYLAKHRVSALIKREIKALESNYA